MSSTSVHVHLSSSHGRLYNTTSLHFYIFIFISLTTPHSPLYPPIVLLPGLSEGVLVPSIHLGLLSWLTDITHDWIHKLHSFSLLLFTYLMIHYYFHIHASSLSTCMNHWSISQYNAVSQNWVNNIVPHTIDIFQEPIRSLHKLLKVLQSFRYHCTWTISKIYLQQYYFSLVHFVLR